MTPRSVGGELNTGWDRLAGMVHAIACGLAQQAEQSDALVWHGSVALPELARVGVMPDGVARMQARMAIAGTMAEDVTRTEAVGAAAEPVAHGARSAHGQRAEPVGLPRLPETPTVPPAMARSLVADAGPAREGRPFHLVGGVQTGTPAIMPTDAYSPTQFVAQTAMPVAWPEAAAGLLNFSLAGTAGALEPTRPRAEIPLPEADQPWRTAAPRGAPRQPGTSTRMAFDEDEITASVRGRNGALPSHGQGAGRQAERGAHGAGQPIHGDVILDGRLVGRWMTRALSDALRRSPSGPTGVDGRRDPLVPGISTGA